MLIRSSNGVALTENGKQLLTPIQTLVNDQRRLSQTIYEINKVVAGTLRIGTFTSVSTHWLPAIIKNFQKIYPQVEFKPLAGDYDDITKRIFLGKIDCGFLTAPVADDLSFFPLYQDPMMALLPIDHPLAKKKTLILDSYTHVHFLWLEFHYNKRMFEFYNCINAVI